MFWRVVMWPFPPANSSRDARQLLHLRCRQQSAGNLAAHHLHARLALAVDAVLQAERAEFVFGNFPRQEGVGLAAEGFDLLADQVVVLEFEFARERRVCLR